MTENTESLEVAKARINKASDETLKRKLVTSGLSREEVDSWSRERLLTESHSRITTSASSTPTASPNRPPSTTPSTDMSAFMHIWQLSQERAEKQRREDMERMEKQRREDLARAEERMEKQRNEDLERVERQRREDQQRADEILRITQQQARDAQQLLQTLTQRTVTNSDQDGHRGSGDTADPSNRARLIRNFGDVLKHALTKFPDHDSKICGWLDYVQSCFDDHLVPNDIRHILLLPHLNDKAKRLLCKLPSEVKEDFTQLKLAIAKEFRMTSAQHKIAFDKASKQSSESHVQYKSRIESLLDYYLTSRKATNYDDLRDLLIADKMKEGMSNELTMHVVNQEGSKWYRPDELADVCDNYVNNSVAYAAKYDRSSSGNSFSVKKNDWRPQNNPNNSDKYSHPNQNWKDHKVTDSQTYANSNQSYFPRNSDHRKGNNYNGNNNHENTSGTTRSDKSRYFDKNRSRSSDSKGRQSASVNCVLINVPTDSHTDCDTDRQTATADVHADRLADLVDEQLSFTQQCMNEEQLSFTQQCMNELPNADLDYTRDGSLAVTRVHVEVGGQFSPSVRELEIDTIVYVPLLCEGIPLKAALDSGTELTCVNSNSLSHEPILSINTIELRPAFGPPLLANLATLRLATQGMDPDDHLEVNCAVSPHFNSDCLLAIKDFQRLKRRVNEETLTRPVDKRLPMVGMVTRTTAYGADKDSPFNDMDRALDNPTAIVKATATATALANDMDCATTVVSSDDTRTDVAKFRYEQRNDPNLSQIFEKLTQTGNCDGFFIHDLDNLQYRTDTVDSFKVTQLVVPQSRKQQILTLAHDSIFSGHMVVDKMIQRIRLNFFWPSMRADIKEYCSSCRSCQLRKRQVVFDRTPISPIGRSGEAFHTMHFDLAGPLNVKSDGYDYCLVVVDSFSKWVEIVPLRNLTAKSTCEGLLQVFARTGIPSVLISDKATNNTAKFTAEFEKMLGVSPRFSTPFHPEGNGLAERHIQNVKNCLHHAITAFGNKWPKNLPFISWALNEKPSSTTHLSPMALVYGRQARGPLSLLEDFWTNNYDVPVKPQAISDYLVNLKNRLATFAAIADAACEKQQSTYANQYNKRAVSKSFVEGDKVIVLIKTNTHSKLMSTWTGPCVILEVLPGSTYLVSMPGGGKRTFHANLLRKYLDPVQHAGIVNGSVLSAINDSDSTVHASVNLVGVIDDFSEDFGEVVEVPVFNTPQSVIDFEGLIDSQCPHLSVIMKKELCTVLTKHNKVFSDVPGLCKIGQHSIRVSDDKAIPRRKIYPVPMCYRQAVEDQIQDLLKYDIIEPSTSPFAHPVVCVRKKDNSIRLAVDYRAINSITIPDRFPMANANELLLTVGKSNYITSLDCTQGFFQIKLADDGSRERSAFVTHRGQYQFKRMSFGLSSASETYQKCVNKILEPIQDFAKAFIDDIAVHSDTWRAHLNDLDDALQRISDSGITLKISKCSFAQPRIKYLGHIIGGGTHTPDLEKLRAVADLVFPQTKRQMRSLIGLISYYRMYMPNLSEITKSLTDMIKKGHPTKLCPGEEELAAFEEIKSKLVSPPILRCPDFSLSFTIQADASKTAIASCLTQFFPDGEHPIAFASAKLTQSQIHWATVEKEAFAIIHALKKFDSFIYGREIRIVTDHNPLYYLTEVAPDNPRLTRWRLGLQRYNILSITHRKGIEHINCDALSRLLTTS